jgi:hypothetical protein
LSCSNPDQSRARRVFTTAILACLVCVFCATGTPAEPLTPFANLPPDVQSKFAQLAAILAAQIQSGQLTEEQIRSGINQGDAPGMIRSLGPDAARLLQEIAEALKARYTDDELGAILGGLMGAR